MQIKINERLKEVANLITENSSVMDIGCDHAFLDIYLAQNKKMKKIIASDNKEGPLKQAKENIKKYQVEDRIILKLGNGIEPIEEDIDTIIISGMGGFNIIGILKYQKERYRKVKTLILSPNHDTKEVRKEIVKLGFYIEEEKLIKENKNIYPILRFQRGKKKYHYEEYLYGPILMKRKDSLLLEYLQKEKEWKERLLSVLPKKYFFRRLELKKELKVISKVLSFSFK